MPDNRANRPGVVNVGLGTKSTQSRSAGEFGQPRTDVPTPLLDFKNHGLSLDGVYKSVFQLR